MRYFKTPERSQLLLLTNVDLNTAAPIGSAVYAIDKLVDQLDTKEIERTYDLENERGGLPIHPKTIIKLALYAMHNCRFSLRKMEYDTEYNLSYRWLTGNIKIDHSTIGKFLVKYKKLIVELFAQVVEIGVEKDLVDFEVLAIDTVKIRANASYKQFKSVEGIEKEKAKIRVKIYDLLEKAKDENIKEIDLLNQRTSKLEQATSELKWRIEAKIKKTDNEKDKERLEKKEKINITDFDCIKVKQANGEKNPGYCVTVAADTKTDFITDLEMSQNNDAKILPVIIEGSKENTGEAHDVILADSGFSSIDNLEKLEAREQDALIPDRQCC